MFNYYLRLSWLSLRQTPVISFLMVLAIAIGIGVSMTTLTVYHLKNTNPMAHKNSQLYAVQLQTKDQSSTEEVPEQVTYQDVMNLRRSGIAKRQVGMYKTGMSVQSENKAIAPFIELARVTDSSFFSMFEVKFIHGAPWDKSIDEVGSAVVVISESLNEKLFGGKNSIGEMVTLDSKLFTVTGVMKDYNPMPVFYDLNNGSFREGQNIYIPLSLASVNEYVSWGNNNSWKNESITTFAQKLRSESMWLQYWVELENVDQQQQYQAFLAAYVEGQQRVGRFSRKDAAGYLKNVQQWLDNRKVVGQDSQVLVGLSFMFLVVCLVNTIGLLLAKFLRRAPQVGVRRALGASQFEVFKQHLVEVSLVGFFGGTLGLLFTLLGLMGLRTIYSNFDHLSQIDLTMTLTVFLVSILSSVLAGLYPAYRICRTNPAVHLKTQ
ncbi:MAG: putative ABC transport system permease protein [Phenylobacterium sp.]|jgi:putative ABC transport system permease protein